MKNIKLRSQLPLKRKLNKKNKQINKEIATMKYMHECLSAITTNIFSYLLLIAAA